MYTLGRLLMIIGVIRMNEGCVPLLPSVGNNDKLMQDGTSHFVGGLV